MRHLAITGMEAAAIILRIFLGEAMRATPPSARICAGTRSSAMTETAPAFSAISACLASVTSIMTPPLSISARPVLRRRLVEFPLVCDMVGTFSRISCQLSAVSFQYLFYMLRARFHHEEAQVEIGTTSFPTRLQRRTIENVGGSRF